LEVAETVFEFPEKLEAVLRHEPQVMVEQFMVGREVTCGILDAEASFQIRPLPVTEIIPKEKDRFWDYEAKYTPGATEEITPADLPPEVTSQVMDMAAHVHEIVGCRGWSRSDFILTEAGPVWLEVNSAVAPGEQKVYNYIAGLGGRDISAKTIEKIFDQLLQQKDKAGVPGLVTPRIDTRQNAMEIRRIRKND